MNAFARKAALTVGTTAAALTLALAGAGAASAAPIDQLPKVGTKYGSLQQCLTVGNTLAQQGKIVTFSCQPAGGGAYKFYYTI